MVKQITHRQRISVHERIAAVFPASAEQRLLAAAVQTTGIGTQQVRTPVMLYTRRASNQVFVPATQFATEVTVTSSLYEVRVMHRPTGYAADCWDLNHNGTPDLGAEDLNLNGVASETDCYPSEAFVFVKYDETKATPNMGADGPVGGRSSAVIALGKVAALGLVESGGSKYVRLALTSPQNLKPLPSGMVGVVYFNRAADNGVFTLHERDRSTPNELLVKRFSATPSLPATVSLSPAVITDPVAGAFSPDGNRLLLAGMFQNTRPVLVRTANLQNVEGAVRVGEFYSPVRGLSWVREDSYQACNWVGGVLHPASHVLARPMRGALDDLKLYAGLRDEDSIRSEAALGIERLTASSQTGQGDRVQGPCANNSDCDAYTLCQSGRCSVVACDPTSPTACAAQNARCTLRPSSVRTSDFDGPTAPRWVCAVDCSSDAECFTQSCTNGPCRFCEEQTSSCIECRESVQTVGNFVSRVVEGCPDRNSFLCDDGACETECYSIRDGVSVYRCDPTLEFCRNGRCESLRWDWTDVAPASLQGLAETGYTTVPGAIRTVALGESTAIEIKAYGKGDYGHSPELLVEAQLVRSGGVNPGSYYSGEWFRVGRIMVDNRTKADAMGHPFVLQVPHPISDLRMRLVHTPYENLDNAATGLGAKDKDFCVADVGTGSTARCKFRPPGSAQHLGYSAEVPFDQQARDCARDRAGCPSVVDPLRKYLGDGSPAILVTEVRVNGASATMDTNPVCSWEGTLDPIKTTKNLCAAPGDGTGVNISCDYGGTITSVDYAFYGRSDQITGTCADAQFTTATNICGRNIEAEVRTRCLGKQACRIIGTDYGDSCPNFVKRTAVRARCTYAPTTQQLRKKLYYGNVAEELSASKRALCGSTCPTTSLLDFRTVSSGAYGLLNCTYNNPATNQVALLDFSLPPYVQQFQAGSVRENANSCFVEVDAVRREQCYEFIGGDVSMDALAGPEDVFQTLEFTLPRGFAHDEGFTRVGTPTAALSVAVSGLVTGAVVRIRNVRNGTTVDVPGDGGTAAVTRSFAGNPPVGQGYQLEIAAHPANYLCALVGGTGTIRAGGVVEQVSCRRAGKIWIEGQGFNGNAVTVQLFAVESRVAPANEVLTGRRYFCLLYTSDAADE